MRIAAWNLNHRARLKAIPDGVIAEIKKIRPDTLVLTEYVDGESRSDFKRQLAEAGLGQPLVSDPLRGHNQVLIASNRPQDRLPLVHPGDSHAASNFLAVHFRSADLTLVGVRAPTYKPAGQNQYWCHLTALLETHSKEKIILIGDLNADPEKPDFAGGKSLQRLRASGWQIPYAQGEWSFVSPKGAGARIDHIVASPKISPISAAYITDVAKASSERRAISDHAILVCDVDVDD